MKTMQGPILPGNSTVVLRGFDVSEPGHGEVPIRTERSAICGSEIRCICREPVGKGADGYGPGTIAGHEPCRQTVETGFGPAIHAR